MDRVDVQVRLSFGVVRAHTLEIGSCRPFKNGWAHQQSRRERGQQEAPPLDDPFLDGPLGGPVQVKKEDPRQDLGGPAMATAIVIFGFTPSESDEGAAAPLIGCGRNLALHSSMC